MFKIKNIFFGCITWFQSDIHSDYVLIVLYSEIIMKVFLTFYFELSAQKSYILSL